MELEETVTAILNIKEGIQQASSEALSEEAVRLASYKATLGEFVANSRRARDDRAARLEHQRAILYKRYRPEMSIRDAEQRIKLETKSESLELNEATYRYEQLRLLHQDVHDILDAIKSRFIYLLQERGENAAV